MIGFTKKLHERIAQLEEQLKQRTKLHVASDMANETQKTILREELRQANESIVSHRQVARGEVSDIQNKLAEAEEKTQTLTNQLEVSERLREIEGAKVKKRKKKPTTPKKKPASSAAPKIISDKLQAYYDRGR